MATLSFQSCCEYFSSALLTPLFFGIHVSFRRVIPGQLQRSTRSDVLEKYEAVWYYVAKVEWAISHFLATGTEDIFLGSLDNACAAASIATHLEQWKQLICTKPNLPWMQRNFLIWIPDLAHSFAFSRNASLASAWIKNTNKSSLCQRWASVGMFSAVSLKIKWNTANVVLYSKEVPSFWLVNTQKHLLLRGCTQSWVRCQTAVIIIIEHKLRQEAE